MNSLLMLTTLSKLTFVDDLYFHASYILNIIFKIKEFHTIRNLTKINLFSKSVKKNELLPIFTTFDLVLKIMLPV